MHGKIINAANNPIHGVNIFVDGCSDCLADFDLDCIEVFDHDDDCWGHDFQLSVRLSCGGSDGE